MIEKPINVTLPATGGTATLVSLPANQKCSDYALQARGFVDMLISDVVGVTTYWTVKAGTSISLSQVFGAGHTMFYAISGSTEDVIEVQPILR